MADLDEEVRRNPWFQVLQQKGKREREEKGQATIPSSTSNPTLTTAVSLAVTGSSGAPLPPGSANITRFEARVQVKNRIVIPVQVFRALGLKRGDIVIVQIVEVKKNSESKRTGSETIK